MKHKRLIKLNDNRKIGDFHKPYIVAELNTSHFGNISIANKFQISTKKSTFSVEHFVRINVTLGLWDMSNTSATS